MSQVIIAGDTSGTITLAAPAVAGSGVLTLPVATDTLVGKATTDTLTNKTLTAPVLGTPASGILTSCTGLNYDGFKNRIINGAMVIDQRNAGASVSIQTTTGYMLDRWTTLVSQNSKFTVQQTPSATETGYATRVGAGFTNYLACTSSSAYSLAAGDYFTIRQAIEGYNIADLAWGTASAQTVTLSFWVRSSLTGTFGGALQNNTSARSYPFTYAISSANTWEQKSVTIAGDTSGTWQTGINTGIFIYFGLGVGSTYSGTAGAWAGTNYVGATGATSVVGTNTATFYITGVQLEKGSTATSFDCRPYGTELALCQRYFTKFVGSSSLSTYAIGEAVGVNKVRWAMQCPVAMRSSPTFTSAGSSFVWAYDRIGSVLTALTLDVATTQIQSISATNSAGVTVGQAGTISAGSYTNTNMAFSAEL
jgi:hypothetical protein